MMLMQHPTAGFDEPLALLAGCHQRIAGFCDTLERLEQHLQEAGCDAAAKTAAERIIAYFDHAAPLHHDDEEIDLLPLLQLRAEAKAVSTIEGWAERLSAEHRAQEAVWAVLRGELQRIIDGYGASLSKAVEFINMERDHYQFEDREVFPLAGKLLREEDIERLGRVMARRRNRPYPEDV